MKIGFVFTNFNSSKYSLELISSLSKHDNFENYIIVIVDNNSENSEKLILEELNSYRNVKLIYNDKNVGYFQGLNVGIDYIRSSFEQINYLVIGNNDLIFPEDFFYNLNNALYHFDIFPVLSPNIITLDGVHQNPHVIDKISKFRRIIYDIYYFNYYIALIINYIANITKKFTGRKDAIKNFDKGQPISLGYGACFIIGPLFFKYFNSLDTPTFLMGEEYFLSKQLETKGLVIYYEPSILIIHQHNASVKNLPNKRKWEFSKKSHLEIKRLNNKY